MGVQRRGMFCIAGVIIVAMATLKAKIRDGRLDMELERRSFDEDRGIRRLFKEEFRGGRDRDYILYVEDRYTREDRKEVLKVEIGKYAGSNEDFPHFLTKTDFLRKVDKNFSLEDFGNGFCVIVAKDDKNYIVISVKIVDVQKYTFAFFGSIEEDLTFPPNSILGIMSSQDASVGPLLWLYEDVVSDIIRDLKYMGFCVRTSKGCNSGRF